MATDKVYAADRVFTDFSASIDVLFQASLMLLQDFQDPNLNCSCKLRQ